MVGLTIPIGECLPRCTCGFYHSVIPPGPCPQHSPTVVRGYDEWNPIPSPQPLSDDDVERIVERIAQRVASLLKPKRKARK